MTTNTGAARSFLCYCNHYIVNVIIGCESSGAVREAFLAAGHDAYSCDITRPDMPSERHIQCDVRKVLGWGWDLAIFHPPCTDLAVSGSKHFPEKRIRQEFALEFVCELLNAPIEKIALENPVGVISSRIRPADQIIHPYWFGHREFKSTCLWLKNLPLLVPTGYIEPPNRHLFPLLYKEWSKIHYASPGPNRGKLRSITYAGIAAAMAQQWGSIPEIARL